MIRWQFQDVIPCIIEEACYSADTESLVNAREVQLLTEEARIEMKIAIGSVSPHLHRSRQIGTVDEQTGRISSQFLTEAGTVRTSSLILRAHQSQLMLVGNVAPHSLFQSAHSVDHQMDIERWTCAEITHRPGGCVAVGKIEHAIEITAIHCSASELTRRAPPHDDAREIGGDVIESLDQGYDRGPLSTLRPQWWVGRKTDLGIVAHGTGLVQSDDGVEFKIGGRRRSRRSLHRCSESIGGADIV